MLAVKAWQTGRVSSATLFSLVFLFSSFAQSESSRSDYDLDDNGLIEINDLADLNEIRNNLDGTSLYGANIGCPDAEGGTANGGCFGFELTTDLDFDTNQNGVIDASDAYWNNAAGWLPIGGRASPFTAEFAGNGFIISNLMINRPNSFDIGLFNTIDGAYVHQVTLANAEVIGYATVGALVAYAKSNNRLEGNVVNAKVESTSIDNGYRTSMGGLVGNAHESNIISQNHFTGTASSQSNYTGGLVGTLGSENSVEANAVMAKVEVSNASAGGLVGYVNSNNTIKGNFVSGLVLSQSVGGGLVGSIFGSTNTTIEGNLSSVHLEGFGNNGGLIGSGNSNNPNTLKNNYWAVDTSGQSLSYGSSEANSYIGLDISVLRCAIQANTTPSNSSCVSTDGTGEGLSGSATLYKNWDNYGQTNDQGAFVVYWSYGTDQQLPGLTINGTVYRDSDNDTVPDHQDDFPLQSAASQDTDSDGFPDAWNTLCDTSCQTQSGLALDLFPDHAEAYLDGDIDGRPDEWSPSCDVSCQSESALTLDAYLNDTDNDGLTNDVDDDDNGDGVVDADADSDGLIDIFSLEQLNAVRYQLDGAGLRLTSSASPLNSSGCPIVMYESLFQHRCHGYELTADLDFDTNQNGVINSGDAYWDYGRGWLPIGDANSPFTGEFNGQGFTIKHLLINRGSTSESAGLFGVVNGAYVHRVTLIHAQVIGKSSLGALVGFAKFDNRIEANIVRGDVESTYEYGKAMAGGLLGRVGESNTITQNFFSGSVSVLGDYVGGLASFIGGENLVEANVVMAKVETSYTGSPSNYANAGGLIGYISDGNTLRANFISGAVETKSGFVGGLAGYMHNGISEGNLSTAYVSGTNSGVGGLIGSGYSNTIKNDYWAADTSAQLNSSGIYERFSLSSLRCAVQANTPYSVCGSAMLYKDWDTYGKTNDQGVFEPYWDFGTDQQLPALTINGTVYRDSDGDGIEDAQDDLPFSYAASVDSDQDGAPDIWNKYCDEQCQLDSGLTHDAFPLNLAAAQDADADGMPDVWNVDCDITCQTESSLTLDPFSNDTDNDGLTNDIDDDDNGDGVVDVDADSDGLIDISTLAQLNAMRYQLEGTGLRLTNNSPLNTSGCPLILYENSLQTRCHGYELLADLDFDTNDNGFLDAGDDYWFDGAGWIRIGSTNSPFTGEFNGQGFTIKHLLINRASTSESAGLFGAVNEAFIHHVILTHVQVAGKYYVGALVGYAQSNNRLLGNVVMGEVASTHNRTAHAGGLVGYLDTSNTVEANTIMAVVKNAHSYIIGDAYAGGLVGYSSNLNRIQGNFVSGAVLTQDYTVVGGLGGHISNSTIEGNISTVYVNNGADEAGGLIGVSSSNTLKNNYWARDVSGQPRSSGSSEANSYVGLDLSALRCAVQSNTSSSNSSCVSADGSAEGLYSPVVLYKNWGIYGQTNAQGVLEPYWDFGTDQQLPALTFNGTVYRDSDGDGVGDTQDDLPFNFAAAVDTDLDGAPDNWNLTCDVYCQLDSGLMLDEFPNNAAASVDTDSDGLPDSWSLTCNTDCQQASGLTLDMDDDNDGVVDGLDAFSKNAAASIDIDQDALPDEWNPSCDQTCQSESGLVLDQSLNDTDNDGVTNYLDAFIMNSAASIDADQDGMPDEWNANCDEICQSESGLVLDQSLNDTDNDRFTNDVDALPQNAAASVDSDLDGFPDEWNDNCDVTCQSESGLVLDGLPNNAAASTDADQDGFPDVWNTNCDATCQSESGLVLDPSQNDFDNDGLVDANDPDNTVDNGAPTLTEVPPNQSFIVTNEAGSVAEVLFDSLFYQDFSASDLVSSHLEFIPSINGVDLELNENDQYELAAGINSVEWSAIDEAGNRSNAMIQVIKVYPKVKFSMSSSVIGEGSIAKIQVELTGTAPEYPVEVLAGFGLSDLDASDVAEGFDLDSLHIITIDRGEDAIANRIGYLDISIVDDGVIENDELLNVSLQSILNTEEHEVFYTIDESHNHHELTVTYRNLAPEITLTVQQGGNHVTEIAPSGGDVTITAYIYDGNGNDIHTFSWGLDEIGVVGGNHTSVTFDPVNLSEGEYTLSLEVTDNGINPLSDTAEVVVTVLPIKQEQEKEQGVQTSANSGGSGGGAFGYYLLLFFFIAGYRTRRFYKY